MLPAAGISDLGEVDRTLLFVLHLDGNGAIRLHKDPAVPRRHSREQRIRCGQRFVHFDKGGAVTADLPYRTQTAAGSRKGRQDHDALVEVEFHS